MVHPPPYLQEYTLATFDRSLSACFLNLQKGTASLEFGTIFGIDLSRPSEAYGSYEYPQSPEAKIESRVHGSILHINHRGVQSVEGSHTTPCSMGATAKGAANARRHEREGVDEKDGDQRDDHEELGEAGVVMGSGTLEQLRC